MINTISKVSTDLERNLKNISIAFRTYTAVFIILFFTFFLYGVVPLASTIKTKINLSKEMTNDYKVMQINLVNLQQASTDMASNKPFIAYLDRFMPEETSVQTYMLDFIQAVGESGFYVKEFSQDSSGEAPGQVDLTISLEGSNYPTNLIKQIEVLKRVTQVKKVNLYISGNGQMTIVLTLTIYNLIV